MVICDLIYYLQLWALIFCTKCFQRIEAVSQVLMVQHSVDICGDEEPCGTLAVTLPDQATIIMSIDMPLFQLLFEWTQGGLISISVYQGHELGIFKQMAEFTSPKTSQEIAEALDMKEQ